MTQPVTTRSPHPSIRVRTNGPVTEISVRTPLARWYRICLWSILPVLFIAIPVACVLAGHLPRPVRLIPAVAVAVVALALLLLLLIAFANLVASARLLFDGQTLHVQPSGAHYAIPVEDIRAVSLSTHPRRRLDINPSASPRRLFTRRRPISLDIDTPAGRIQFLRGRTPADLPPLLATLAPLLNLPTATADFAPPPVTAKSDSHTRGDVLGLRVLAAVFLLFAACFAYWELVPAFQSRHWPSVTGRITRSHWERIEPTSSRSSASYDVEAAYTYTVNYNTYTNDRIGFGHDNPGDTVRDYLLSHPAGSTVPVYYDPRNPASSTLIPGPGPIEWFLAGGCGLMVLFTLPVLGLRSTPPDELALLGRYRVSPRKAKEKLTIESMAAATSDLPRWTTPPEVFERDRRTRRRTFLFAAVRTLLILLAVEYAFYTYFSPRLPLLFQSHTLLWTLLGMNLYATGSFVYIALVPTRPAEYRLTPDGIHVSTREHPLIRYQTLHSFSLSDDPGAPHAPTLRLHTKDGMTRTIPLSLDLAPLVIAAVSQHLPNCLPAPRHSSLRGRDWLLGLAVTAVYTVVVGLLIRHNRSYLRAHDAGSLLQLALLLLGPGTLTAPLFYRRRATGQLIPLAFALNFLGMVTTMLYALLPRILSAIP